MPQVDVPDSEYHGSVAKNTSPKGPQPGEFILVSNPDKQVPVMTGQVSITPTPQAIPKQTTSLPQDARLRKEIPMARGLLDYFPDALIAVAQLSYVGNAQHNPGQDLHWAKDKSTDHADCLMRHLVERGEIDTDLIRHSTKVAWRALALLQIEIEKESENQ